MTEQQLRQKVVETACAWVGCKESNGTHRPIIDLYNTQKPLPRGYPMKYNDAWCAAFATAVAIKAGTLSVIAPECGCGKMIAGFQKKNSWVENDAYVPSPGDYIFYDWNDKGIGDNTSPPHHVGIVVSCANGKIKVVEGNMNNAVGYRTINVNGRYIRGFATPKYSTICGGMAAPTTPVVTTPTSTENSPYIVARGDTLSKIAAKYGTNYKVLAELNGIANPNVISVGQRLFPNVSIALNYLVKLGVINSPTYWLGACNKGTVKNLDRLIVCAALKAKASSVRTGTAELGLTNLVNAKVISSSEVSYWSGLRSSVTYMEDLLKALGGAVV